MRDEVVAVERRIILALVLGAVAVRLLYLLLTIGTPYFGAPFLDELYHWLWARDIASGKVLGDQVFFRAPLYSYGLGLLLWLGADFFFIRLLQHFLGVFTVVLIYLLGKEVFGRTVGIISAALYGLFATVIFFEGEMLDMVLVMMWVPLILLVGIRFLSAPTTKKGLLLGILVGLCAITRPSILVFLPILLLMGTFGREAVPDLRHRWLPVAALLAGTIVIIVPVTIRNLVVERCFVPIGIYGGVNFYIGNSPTADGYTSKTPHRYPMRKSYEDSVELFARRHVEEEKGRTVTSAEVDRYWWGKALWNVYEHPGHFIGLVAKKLVLFWQGHEIKNNKNIYMVAEYNPLLKVLLSVFNFAIWAPLGLLGMGVALVYRRNRAVWLLILFVCTYCLSVILFFVCARFRMPAVGVVLIFAAYFVCWVWQNFNPHPERVRRAGIILALVFLVVNTDWFGVRAAVNVSQDYWTVGNCWKEKGEFVSAIVAYRTALRDNPEYTEAWNNLGEVYFAQGELAKAEDAFSKALRTDAVFYPAYNNLGVVYETRGDVEKALSYYQQAVTIEPAYVKGLQNLIDLYKVLGRQEEAQPYLMRLQQLSSGV